jgi:hypothetical protein
MPIPAEMSGVRELFTATEYALLEASYAEAWSQAELKKKLDRARELRDKWRDQYARQRRASQKLRGDLADSDNDRSQQKSEIFAQAVGRFESMLAQSAAAGTSAKKSTVAKTPKSKRVQAHRKTRTSVRKELKQSTTAGKASRSVAAAAPAVAPAPVAAKAAKPLAARPKAKPAVVTKAAKKSAKRTKTVVPTGRPGTVLPPAKNKAAIAAAKKNRIQISGLTTRTRGHVSATVKRSQAKRDTRGKR